MDQLMNRLATHPLNDQLTFEEGDHNLFYVDGQAYDCSRHFTDEIGFAYIHWLALNSTAKKLSDALRKSADSSVLNAQTHSGWTPLMLAAHNGRTQIVHVLLKADADVNLKNNDGYCALYLSALFANTVSNESTVRMLLKAGANVNMRTNLGNTVLINCAIMSNNRSSESCVRMLLKAGADVNARTTNGWSALMGAVRDSAVLSSEKTVHMLLNAGAHVDAKNNIGFTALLIAVCNSSTDSSESTVRMLLDAGADVNLSDHDGSTALTMAVFYVGTDSSEATVRMLLHAGANVNAKDNDGNTALMMAVHSPNTVRVLLDAGADVNAKNNIGFDALMMAAAPWKALNSDNSSGALNVESLRMLLAAGANVHAKNNEGKTAFELNLFDPHKEKLLLLLQAGSHFDKETLTACCFPFALELGLVELKQFCRDCCICRDEFQHRKDQFVFQCSHALHTHCFIQNYVVAQRKTCPLCRDQIKFVLCGSSGEWIRLKQ